jgi:hypothetical protein
MLSSQLAFRPAAPAADKTLGFRQLILSRSTANPLRVWVHADLVSRYAFEKASNTDGANQRCNDAQRFAHLGVIDRVNLRSEAGNDEVADDRRHACVRPRLPREFD